MKRTGMRPRESAGLCLTEKAAPEGLGGGSKSVRHVEAVIVGAGIVGSALAYQLARRGARVEAGEPGCGTSAASFA